MQKRKKSVLFSCFLYHCAMKTQAKSRRLTALEAKLLICLLFISSKQTTLTFDSNVMTVSMRLVLSVSVDMTPLPPSCDTLAIITL